MSIMSNIVRKALVLWACTARAIDRLHCDRRLRQGRCIGAGGAEFCAFLRCFSGKREKRSGVHRQRLVAVDTAGECQDSLHGALVLPPDRTWSVGSARPRSRAIPPTPRPRGRLSVLAFCDVARGAEVPRVRSRADYDGGERRGARLTRLLARRELGCPPRPWPSRLPRVAPAREFAPFVAAGAGARVAARNRGATCGSRPGPAFGAPARRPSSISGRTAARGFPRVSVACRCDADALAASRQGRDLACFRHNDYHTACRGPSSLDRLKKTHGFHTKCVSKLDDVEQADVAFAALDASDIVTMQVRQLCEAFLRQAALHPRSGPAAACGSGRLHPRRSRI